MKWCKYRDNYWSSSDLMNKCLKTWQINRPYSATSEEWDKWENDFKENHKVLYYFTEHFVDHVQDVVLFPLDVYNSIRIYIRNRFISRLHLIDTKLTPGEWHETDTRMLYGMFQLLVDFIEIEKAHMWVRSSENKPIWIKFKWLRWLENRSKEDGLSYLDWEINIDDKDYGCCLDHQKRNAKEQLALYKWWVEDRPNRPDLYDEANNLSFDEINKKEEEWEVEDTEMLIRLINIRRSLWT